MKKLGSGVLLAGAAVAMLAAIASLGRHESFGVTFLYVTCTLAVGAITTLVTIFGITGLGQERGGRAQAAGLFEAGLLIGLFVVSPLALTGAFTILEAVVGSP